MTILLLARPIQECALSVSTSKHLDRPELKRPVMNYIQGTSIKRRRPCDFFCLCQAIASLRNLRSRYTHISNAFQARLQWQLFKIH